MWHMAYKFRAANQSLRKFDEKVEECGKAALWDEVKDRLNENAYGLSGGQQQRLCIAHATIWQLNRKLFLWTSLVRPLIRLLFGRV